MKFVNSLIFFVLFAGPAWSAPSDRSVKIAVKFDQSFYKLEITKQSFSYADGPISYRTTLADCNRSRVRKMADEYFSLQKIYSSSGDRGKTPFDVELTSDNGKVTPIARGSKFGIWLREFPKKMMYFNAEVKTSCKR